MKHVNSYAAVILLLFAVGAGTGCSAMAPSGLMCELLSRPELTVITDSNPEFGWIVNSDVKDDIQSAYQVMVATCPSLLDDNNPDMWDTGKLEFGTSINVEYVGKSLKPDTYYYWKVRTWNKADIRSKWSYIQKFRTADKLGIYSTPQYPLEVRDVKPAVITGKSDGYWFIDFGRAAFGTIELVVNSPDDRTIEVHLGEQLSGDNTVNRKPEGTIRYRRMDLKVTEGRKSYRVKITPDKRNTGPKAIKMPSSLFEVMPFRYCELVNYPGTLEKDSITQLAVNYPFDDSASDFHCDNEILNQVWDLCKYSIKATSFCGIYVDGDRERIPYEADAYINQLGHYCVDREYSMARATHEYLINNPTWPTEWILSSVLMAYEDYMYTGNLESLRHYYEDLKAKTLHMLADDRGLISVNTGKVTPEILKSIHYDGKLKDLVDWPPASFTRDQKYGERDHYDMAQVNTVVNAYFHRNLELMLRISSALYPNDTSDETRFWLDLMKKNEKSFNEVFFDPDKGIYIDGIGSGHSALHANMFPLAFGMVPRSKQAGVVEFIKSRGMACSVYGSQHLLDALYNTVRYPNSTSESVSYDEYALSLMTAIHDRSWYNMIKVGSTVTLEAWDWKYKNNLDWNHAWGAAPANIIPRHLMGIKAKPGFGLMYINPQPGNLKYARLTHPTIRGPVHLEYKRQGDNLSLMVDIPANTSAIVTLPSWNREYEEIKIDGKPMKFNRNNRRISIREIGSGGHDIEWVLK